MTQASHDLEQASKQSTDELPLDIWRLAASLGPAIGDLDAIEGIGPSVANDILEFFAEKHNREVLKDLKQEIGASASRRRKSATRPWPARRWSSPARSRR